MNSLNYLIIGMLMISCIHSHEDHTENHDHMNDHDHQHTHDHAHGFNAALAEELGADQFGMRKYVIAYLKAGPNRNQDEETVTSMQKAHLENIQRMADEGQLVLAGPFLDDGDVKGIYIFDVESVEEAEALTQTDPMIESGRLVMELHPWYGSAALKKVNELHNSIQNTNISTH